MRKPYVIASSDFEATSGGIRVMWGLYGWLLAKGQIAYINRFPSKPCIGIYPEIFHGNPANAETVVRYILNKPGVMGAKAPDGKYVAGPTKFDETDKLYYFSKLFGETDESHYLFLPICDLHIFKNQHKTRNKKAVFFGKGYTGTGLHPSECIEINRKFADDQQALADLLNECEVLYCYDAVTAMLEIARLCGCRIIYFPSWYSKEKFSEYETGMDGINWGEDEEKTIDSGAFLSHYKSMIDLFSKKLDEFIEETQK